MTDDPGEPDQPDLSDLMDDLEELEATVDSEDERERVREAKETAVDMQEDEVFGRVIYGYDRADLAESFVGSLLFGIPMFVEGGTQEIGQFIADQPASLLATHALALGIVVGILYVAEIQDVRISRPILGYIPRRLAGVMLVAFGTACVMMTLWGRVYWGEPLLAFAEVSVAYVPMALGAALGDILPGS